MLASFCRGRYAANDNFKYLLQRLARPDHRFDQLSGKDPIGALEAIMRDLTWGCSVGDEGSARCIHAGQASFDPTTFWQGIVATRVENDDVRSVVGFLQGMQHFRCV